jgi:hypothetical protein
VAQPAPAPADPAVQQAFDAANALLKAGKWPEALTAFRALEAGAGSERSKALAQLGQSRALLKPG